MVISMINKLIFKNVEHNGNSVDVIIFFCHAQSTASYVADHVVYSFLNGTSLFIPFFLSLYHTHTPNIPSFYLYAASNVSTAYKIL